jgi:stage IV sporulation protein A
MSQARRRERSASSPRHSTVGILVTTDGSVCGIPREEYEGPEARAAEALNRIGKPYVILLNCTEPQSEAAEALAAELSARYGHSCMPVNCTTLTQREMQEILRSLLYAFPVHSFRVFLPSWMDAVPAEDETKSALLTAICAYASGAASLRDAEAQLPALTACESVCSRRSRIWRRGAAISASRSAWNRSSTIRRSAASPVSRSRTTVNLMRLLRAVSGLKEEYERCMPR